MVPDSSPWDEARGESLPASSRIKRGEEFRRVQSLGTRVPAGPMVLLWLPNSVGRRRLGVTVSRRVGNAVARNRVKRRFREIFRRSRGLLPPSIDVVMVARSTAAEVDYAVLASAFKRAASRIAAEGPR